MAKGEQLMWNPDEVNPALKRGKYTIRSKAERKELLMKYTHELREMKISNRTQFSEKNRVRKSTFKDWVKKKPELIELEKKTYSKYKTYTDIMGETANGLRYFSINNPVKEELNDSKGQETIEKVIQKSENSGLNEAQRLNKMSNLLGTNLNNQLSTSNINNEVINSTFREQPNIQNKKERLERVIGEIKRKLDQSAKMSNEQINPAQRSMMNQRIDSASFSLVKKQKTALETRRFTSDYSR